MLYVEAFLFLFFVEGELIYFLCSVMCRVFYFILFACLGSYLLCCICWWENIVLCLCHVPSFFNFIVPSFYLLVFVVASGKVRTCLPFLVAFLFWVTFLFERPGWKPHCLQTNFCLHHYFLSRNRCHLKDWLQQTLDRMSPFDTGIFVLFTSFVCHFAAFPTLDSDRYPGFLSVFPPSRI